MKRLRHEMAAYRIMVQTNRASEVKKIKREIDRTACTDSTHFSPLIFGAGLQSAELITRQFLLRSVIENRINTTLISAIGYSDKSIRYPLPFAWRKTIKSNGISISENSSAILFSLYIMARFLNGVAIIVTLAIRSLSASFQRDKNEIETDNYVYFDSLTRRNIPVEKNTEDGFDIINWYINWSGRCKNINSIRHQVIGTETINIKGIKVEYAKDPTSQINSVKQVFYFILWSCRVILLCMFDLFRGRWWHALLLGEAAKSEVFRLKRGQKPAKEYLFHNSSWIYRPLWTYEAAARGAKIIFYFYSTNIEPLKYGADYADPHVGWRTANWPFYLVWDRYQSDFIKRSVDNPGDVSIVGSIGFYTGIGDIGSFPKKGIAVFDVQPVRDAAYFALGMDFDYYIPSICNHFMSQIFQAAQIQDLLVLYKRKRSIGKTVHYRYRNLIEHLSKEKNFISIDAEAAAQEVIGKAIAVISMPFTATAIIGKEMGKPSVFYDPDGLLDKNDRAAHGIEIVSGPMELQKWLNHILHTDGKYENNLTN